jgi:hypothetical protein
VQVGALLNITNARVNMFQGTPRLAADQRSGGILLAEGAADVEAKVRRFWRSGCAIPTAKASLTCVASPTAGPEHVPHRVRPGDRIEPALRALLPPGCCGSGDALQRAFAPPSAAAHALFYEANAACCASFRLPSVRTHHALRRRF